ncbi:tyrosine-type recombinase/integrase [Hyphococcus lacteus]|uniref:Site-specific integrase n=1 Tax=Hyphococcus lacteus TaxID=3143536 RepID=A0ABV3Z2F1_9PROT
MRKFNEENERIKRKYFRYLREAARQSDASIDKSAAAIIRFEQSTDFKTFKSFHIKQAMEFKKMLKKSKNEKTGLPLSITTISANTRLVKAFFNWLRWQPGFKSRIGQSDAEYFNLSAKEETVAHAHREKPFPSMEQALHAFRQMPYGSDIEKRNRALFAFLLVTGIRDGALASLKLKHVDMIEGKVFQDPREVNTKASKTIYTTFFPMKTELVEAVKEWVRYLREDKLFGPDDPLFPKTKVSTGSERKFQAVGLDRAHWSNAAAIRKIIGEAFEAAGIERFGPHSFRKTLVQYGERVCKTPEEFKAWSQNLGHENVLTTFTSYGAVSRQRQAEIIKNLAA